MKKKSRLRGAASVARTWAGATGIALSAVFYLLDFGTTLSTLRAYYLYEYRCPHAPLSSPLLRHDPVCRAIRSSSPLHMSYGGIFWAGIIQVLLALITSSFMFWLALPPSQHPLRVAYFLPLIQLLRLLKLLLSSCSTTRLKEFLKSQKELSSLYDALGVALETGPHFTIQFSIAFYLWQYSEGSSKQLQHIPNILLISLIASSLSGIYSAAMAMFYTLENQMPFLERCLVSIIFGIQVLAAFLAKGTCAASVYQTQDRLSAQVLVLVAAQFAIDWIFSCFVVHIPCFTHKNESRWFKFAHSLGLALMSRVIGPIYVLTKLNTSLLLWLWGAIFRIIGLMIGPFFVLFWSSKLNPPCHALGSIKGMGGEENRHLVCSMYIGLTVATAVVFMLTTVILIWIHRQVNKKWSGLPTTSPTPILRTKIISPLESSTTPKLGTLFDYFVILLTVLCIKMLAKRGVQKVILYLHSV